LKFKKPAQIKKLKSINRIMLRYFLLLAFLLILLVEVISFMVVKITVNTQTRERISRVGSDLVKVCSGGGDLDGLMRDYRREGINSYVLSADGKVLLPFGADFEEAGIGNLENIVNKLDGVGAMVYSENNNIVYLAAVEYGGEQCFISASYSMKIIQSGVNTLLWYFIIIGALVLLVAIIISCSASQRLSGGLKTLSSTAVRLAKGDFSVNFENAEYSELADLSDTLNTVRDEVKKSGDFQRELLANVSHDLKTPLTMIKAYASMIREISGDNPEKREKHLQVIIDEADRLTGLVNDVLSVSKVSSNLDELNFKVFNLTEYLYGLINKFGYLQETQGYNLMVDIDANLYTRADEEKIGQVVYNLLGNAVNYTGEDKTVYISLKSNLAGDRIKLKIRDTGKGIAKEDLPEIWNRYYRVKENHSRPVKGTGLGLNIVKKILENHKFDFGAESEKDKGSTFWIDFPAVPAEIDKE